MKKEYKKILMQPIAKETCTPDGQKPKLKLIAIYPIGFIRLLLLFRLLVVLRYMNCLRIDERTRNKNEKKMKTKKSGAGSRESRNV